VVEFAGFPVALSGRVQGAMVIATATASLLHALGGERRSGGDHPAVPVVDGSSWRVRAPHGSEALDEDFMTAAGRAAREMPAGVHDALVRFGDDPGECGVLLLRGINLGPVPATPAGAAAVGSSGKDLTSEFALLAAARRLGQPVGYAPELGGRLVQDLIPNRDETDAQVSTSSKVRLDWHTEAAFHPHLPRYLLLACLRADVAAATLVSSIRHLVKVLDADVLDVLRQDRFHTAVDESYLGRRGTRVGPVGPVVRGPAGGERMWFDADLMRGVDAASEEALEVLRHTIEEHHVSVVLEAGDLLVVDNDIVVHGRSAFTPRWDGTDRWLQRSFVVADLGASSAERTGRIIDTRFLQ
jgi:alpha-ketoglutarate-dependent taurine dioxygenase